MKNLFIIIYFSTEKKVFLEKFLSQIVERKGSSQISNNA